LVNNINSLIACTEGIPETISNLDISESDWINLLELAAKNRVLYTVSKNILLYYSSIPISIKPKIDEICKIGDIWNTKLQNTLEFINDSFSNQNIDYLIVKTSRSFPYITYDVDVLVHPDDYVDSINFLNEFGKSFTHPRKQGKFQKNIFINKLLNIDLHKDFSWEGSKYVSNRFVWTNHQKNRIAEITCPTPNSDVELLINMAHVLSERRYLTLLDLVYIWDLSVKVKNWDIVFRQLQLFKWMEPFLNLALIVTQLYGKLFGGKDIVESFPRERLETCSKQYFLGDNIEMPYFLPISFVMDTYRYRISEKRTIPLWDIAYFFFTTIRYHISRKRRFPYYLFWYPLKNLSQ
tara:strand:+ start:683 stop:1735 length:1053 start_codon:yes stop_codon:yes gene_type:complete